MLKVYFPVIFLLFSSLAVIAQQSVTIDQVGNNNQVMIEQSGDENAANVIQKVSNSVSIIEQNGARNEAFQLNNSVDGYNIYNQKITQKGYWNEARQSHLSGNNIGLQNTMQTGNYNYAAQTNTSESSSAFITQIGNYNDAIEKVLWPSTHGEATILQDGNNNHSSVIIMGNQSRSDIDKATIESNGNFNGSTFDPVSILLVGDNHSASIIQGSNSYVNNNTASIYLVNPNNNNSDTGSKANINQEYGDNNTARITAIGMNNGKTDMDQDGQSDRLQVNQYGANHYGELNVFGNGLGGIITQTGNGSYVKVTRTN